MYALVATLAVQALVSMATLTPAVFVGVAGPEIGVDPSRIGIYMAVIYAAACLSAAAAGSPVRRFGAIRMSQAGCVLTAVGLALVAIGHPVLVLIGGVVIGLGYGPITPASSHLLIRQTPPHRRGLVFSLKQTGVPLGGALAGIIVPPLVLVIGWRGAALAVAAACLLAALSIQPLRAAFDNDLDPTARADRGILDAFALVLRQPILRRMAIASLAFASMQMCFNAFIVSFFTDSVGIDLVAAGLIMAVAQGAAMGGRILWGWIGDRLMAPAPLLGWLGFGMAASGIAVALITPAWPVVLMGSATVVLGATGVGWNGVFLGEVARLAPAGAAGLATGGAVAFTFIGAVVSPLIFSTIVELSGYRLAYLTMAVACAFAGVLVGRRRSAQS